ncbi:MAG: hypothetical protein OIF54_13985 [Cohaesibacter sp.]|nr:hypothetical protein [Cohaesibacter sp.]
MAPPTRRLALMCLPPSRHCVAPRRCRLRWTPQARPHVAPQATQAHPLARIDLPWQTAMGWLAAAAWLCAPWQTAMGWLAACFAGEVKIRKFFNPPPSASAK